jgi:hypothetical protein
VLSKSWFLREFGFRLFFGEFPPISPFSFVPQFNKEIPSYAVMCLLHTLRMSACLSALLAAPPLPPYAFVDGRENGDYHDVKLNFKSFFVRIPSRE